MILTGRRLSTLSTRKRKSFPRDSRLRVQSAGNAQGPGHGSGSADSRRGALRQFPRHHEADKKATTLFGIGVSGMGVDFSQYVVRNRQG